MVGTQPPVVKKLLPRNGYRDTTNNYIVIHNDGGNMPASVTRTVLRLRRLSYHYFVSRDGTIVQFAEINRIAKHAGVSKYDNLSNWNRFSIGIALQGRDNQDYTEKQYQSLRKLIQYINLRYKDSMNKPILRHSDIAYPRGRKSDPGKHFNMERLKYDTATESVGQSEAARQLEGNQRQHDTSRSGTGLD